MSNFMDCPGCRKSLANHNSQISCTCKEHILTTQGVDPMTTPAPTPSPAVESDSIHEIIKDLEMWSRLQFNADVSGDGFYRGIARLRALQPTTKSICSHPMDKQILTAACASCGEVTNWSPLKGIVNTNIEEHIPHE